MPFGDPRVARETSCYRETFRDPHDMKGHWASTTNGDPALTHPNNKPSTGGVGVGQYEMNKNEYKAADIDHDKRHLNILMYRKVS